MSARRARPPGALPIGRSRGELLAVAAEGLAHLAHGSALVVAVSGGPDSTALASLVDEVRPDLALTLVHVRHGLRGRELDERDAAVAERLALTLGRPFVVRDVRVERTGEGLEAAARSARLAALRSVAADVGARAIALGHSADDQAETVLLRLARGSGLDGLAAMAPIAGDLVRPLLAVRRVDLARHVTGEGLETVADPMNEDREVRRVRVRQEVLPALARIGPDPVGALTRLADLARDDAELLDASARVAVGREVPVHRVGRALCVPSAALAAAHPALARRVVRLALVEATGRTPTATAVARVLEAAAGGARGMTLPGPVDVTVEHGLVVLAPRGVAAATPEADEDLPLPAVGRLTWPAAGVDVTVARASAGVQLPLTLEGPGSLPPCLRRERLAVVLDGTDRLVLRARRPGDRVRTAVGLRELGDVLAEAGVPRAVRERWPVLAGTERPSDVVWVPGVVVDADRHRAGEAAPAVVVSVAPRRRRAAG